MKKFFTISIAFASSTFLLIACNAKQSAEQLLKDDAQRKVAITTIAHTQSYMNEMMSEMMGSDSCKKMMGQAMMNNTGSMNMMMDMAEKDTAICTKMMTMMHQKPMMMNKMKEMNSKMYTCPMHAEVTSNLPGKCPKCGMDLVKKAEHNMMDRRKM